MYFTHLLSLRFFNHLVLYNLLLVTTHLSYCFSYSTRQLRSKGTSKFHIQLCLSLAAMLIALLTGIHRTKNREVCMASSVLIHYFTLVAWMWMGAEAVVIFKKLVIVFGEMSLRFILLVSVVCWGNHTNTLTNTYTYIYKQAYKHYCTL